MYVIFLARVYTFQDEGVAPSFLREQGKCHRQICPHSVAHYARVAATLHCVVLRWATEGGPCTGGGTRLANAPYKLNTDPGRHPAAQGHYFYSRQSLFRAGEFIVRTGSAELQWEFVSCNRVGILL